MRLVHSLSFPLIGGGPFCVSFGLTTLDRNALQRISDPREQALRGGYVRDCQIVYRREVTFTEDN